MAWPLTSGCNAGNTVSNRCRNCCSAVCHLTRDIPALLTAAGFEIAELDVFYEEGSPKFMAADSLGYAANS